MTNKEAHLRIFHGARWKRPGPEQSEGWLVWLERVAGEERIVVSAKIVEIPERIELSLWQERVQSEINQDIIVVAHSLGNLGVLNAITVGLVEQAKALILVGVTDKVIPKYQTWMNTFLSSPFNYEKIKDAEIPTVVIHAEDDQFIPPVEAEVLAQNLGAAFILRDKGGHFLDMPERDNCQEFSLVLQLVRQFASI